MADKAQLRRQVARLKAEVAKERADVVRLLTAHEAICFGLGHESAAKAIARARVRIERGEHVMGGGK